MAAGRGAHLRAEKRISEASGGRPVVTSAGALVDGVHSLGAQRVALIAPYLPALTTLLIDYLAGHAIEVVDSLSLGVADNCAVGRLDASHLPRLTDRLDLRRADAIVLSACVQMPSLPAIDAAQERTGLPVLSAATATARALLDVLDVPAEIPGGGALLAERVSGRAAG